MTTGMDSKLPDVGTTIFTVMSQLAQDCNAINLSQGFPSFDPDPQLLGLVSHYLQSGANQYAPMAGVPALREALAEKIAQVYGETVDPHAEITITPGATEALFSAIMACVRTGDEVIVFDPAYDSYVPAVTLAGGTARRVPMLLDAANEFSIDWQRLQDTINARTRLIILNYPHNPSGAILDAGDLARLASLLIDREIYIVSDEVYEHIVFDHVPHQSLLRNPELRQRTFVVSSFGKTCHATGWKIGYCVAPAAMTVELRKVHQFNCFSVSTPMQHALAEFTRDKPSHYQLLADFYQKKRDHFIELLSGSGFALTAARSTFFQTADFSAVSDEDDVAFAIRLTREIGVASIPVSVFCEQPPSRTLLRFCFAKDDATLEEAAARLCRL